MNSNAEKQGKTKARMTDQADKPRSQPYRVCKSGRKVYGPMRKKKTLNELSPD